LIYCRDANSGLRSAKEDRSRIFCPTQTPEVQLDHFYITLESWELLLNRYNFLWNFCWNREFLLRTTTSTEC